MVVRGTCSPALVDMLCRLAFTEGRTQAQDLYMQEVSSLRAHLQDVQQQAENRMAKMRAELSAVRSESAAQTRHLKGQLAESRSSPGGRRSVTLADPADASMAAMAAAETELGSLHTALQEAQQALASASTSFEEVQAQRDAAVDASIASEQAIAALQQRCEAAESLSASQRQMVAALQDSLNASDSTHMAALQAGEDEVRELMEAVNTMEDDKGEAKREADCLRQLCTAMQEAQAAAQAAMEELQQQVAAAQVIKLNDDAAAETQAQKLEEGLSAAAAEKQKSQHQMQELDAAVAAASERETNLLAELEAAQAEEAILKSHLQAALSAQGESKAHAQALQEQVTSHRQAAQDIAKELGEARRMLAESRSEVEHLNGKIASAQREAEAEQATHAADMQAFQSSMSTLRQEASRAVEASEIARKEAEARMLAQVQSCRDTAEAAREHAEQLDGLRKKLQEAETRCQLYASKQTGAEAELRATRASAEVARLLSKPHVVSLLHGKPASVMHGTEVLLTGLNHQFPGAEAWPVNCRNARQQPLMPGKGWRSRCRSWPQSWRLCKLTWLDG